MARYPHEDIYAWLTRFADPSLRDLPPPEACASCTHLYLSDMDFSNTVMRALPAFPNLTGIALGGTGITDLSALADCPMLETADIGHHATDLTPLARLTALKSLCNSMGRGRYLPWQIVSPVSDIRPLAGLKSLETLQLWGTRITDLAPLSGLENLHELHLSASSVANLAPLAGLPRLRRLWLDRTNVTDLSALADLPGLHTLDISHTAVADIEPLAFAETLEVLYMEETAFRDLSPLAHLPRLRVLDISSIDAPLEPLLSVQTLEKLRIRGVLGASLELLSHLPKARISRR